MFLFCHFSLCEIIGEDGGGERGGEYVLYELESYPLRDKLKDQGIISSDKCCIIQLFFRKANYIYSFFSSNSLGAFNPTRRAVATTRSSWDMPCVGLYLLSSS